MTGQRVQHGGARGQQARQRARHSGLAEELQGACFPGSRVPKQVSLREVHPVVAQGDHPGAVPVDAEGLGGAPIRVEVDKLRLRRARLLELSHQVAGEAIAHRRLCVPGLTGEGDEVERSPIRAEPLQLGSELGRQGRRPVRGQIQANATLADFEYALRTLPARTTATTSNAAPPSIEFSTRRIFIERPAATAALAGSNAAVAPVPILTYLVNQLGATNGRFAPYSMVTAAGSPYTPADMADDEILINYNGDPKDQSPLWFHVVEGS
jgi:hypothetical protein